MARATKGNARNGNINTAAGGTLSTPPNKKARGANLGLNKTMDDSNPMNESDTPVKRASKGGAT